ncbi:MAG: GNAT superfamily N-acetyltransferase [Motiliproteus sp.]|jgi:GNAT superfamily N-acetyltransferase
MSKSCVSKETVIECLNKGHERGVFDSGVDALNRYITEMALQHQAKDISKTHVLTFKGGPGSILAYVTLSVTTISTQGNENHAGFKKLPRNIPALRLCRLAVDTEYQGKRIGSHLIAFVFSKAIDLSDVAGCAGIIVDAKDESARRFYEGFGFQSLTTDPMTLFLPMATVQGLIECSQ